jgi:hypothetical protein
MNRACLIIIILFALFSQIFGQAGDSTQQLNKKRLRTLTIASSSTYAIALVGLNQLWYADADREPFHFFNDNAEWKQVDKLGHFYSSFYLSYGASKSFAWCGVRQRRADAVGSLTGFLIMLPIEVFDGFSTAYGASTGDLFANASGAGFFFLQSRLWNQVRIQPKFSYHITHYPAIRPDVLGDNLASKILKDYNGETQWLSFDLDKFFKFPGWLNVAVGYGAHGMVYARDSQNMAAGFHPYRQYYVGLDFDLTGIKTRSKALKTIFALASMIKLPAPTIEFSSKGNRFHILYF